MSFSHDPFSQSWTRTQLPAAHQFQAFREELRRHSPIASLKIQRIFGK